MHPHEKMEAICPLTLRTAKSNVYFIATCNISTAVAFLLLNTYDTHVTNYKRRSSKKIMLCMVAQKCHHTVFQKEVSRRPVLDELG